jgi:isopenicillin-N epimerase
LAGAVARINARTGRAPAYASTNGFEQMAIVETSDVEGLMAFQLGFANSHGIEIPFTQHAGQTYVRISVQAYNTAQDLENLEEALLASS